MGSAGVVGARGDSPAPTAFAEALPGARALGDTSGLSRSPSCSLPREGSWCGFLVGEEVQDQAQPVRHISVGQPRRGSPGGTVAVRGALLWGGTTADVFLLARTLC